MLISAGVWVSQVFNYSKLGSHDEVARAVIPLRSWYRQGDQQWEQRASMQPVAKAGKTVWGGEVLLKLRYMSPQVCWATASALPLRHEESGGLSGKQPRQCLHHPNRSGGHRCLCLCSLRALPISLSLLLFVLVTVLTKPLTLQEQEDRRQTWPGQQYPPSYQNIGEGAASWE